MYGKPARRGQEKPNEVGRGENRGQKAPKELEKEAWLFPRELQPREPGPRGRVGKGRSKYLRYLDSKRILSTRLEARGLGGLVSLL